MTPRTYRKDLARLARAQGWRVERTGSDHLRLTHPSTASCVYAPSSPGHWRALKTVRAKLRRALRTTTNREGTPRV